MGSPGMLQGFPTPSCWEGGRGQNPAFAGGAEAGWVGRGLGQVVGSAGDVSPCPQGGEVECSFAPCPVLDCPQHQRHLGPGQCCFTCRDPPAPAGEPVLGGTWGQAGWDLGGGGRGRTPQLGAGREGCRGHLRMGRVGCGGCLGMGKVGGWEYLGTGRVGCRGQLGTGRARGTGGELDVGVRRDWQGIGGGAAQPWGLETGSGYRMGTAHVSSSARTCLSVHQEGEGLGVPVCPPRVRPSPRLLRG